MKKIIKLIIMTVLFLTTFSLNVFADNDSESETISSITSAKTISEYGESGAETVKIEGVDFYVVEKDGTSKALLMSKDIYDVRFGDKIDTYSASTLKTWMDDFYSNTLNSNKRIMSSSVKECLIDTYNGVKYSTTDEYIFPVTFDMVLKYGDKLSTDSVNYSGSTSKAAGYWVLDFADSHTYGSLYYDDGTFEGGGYSTTPVQVVSFNTVTTSTPEKIYYYLNSNGEVSNAGGDYYDFEYKVIEGTNENFGTRVCMWYDLSSSTIQSAEQSATATVLKSGSIGIAGKTYSSEIVWKCTPMVVTQSGDNPVYTWNSTTLQYEVEDSGENSETFKSNQGEISIQIINKSNDSIVYTIEGSACEGYEFLEGYAPTSKEATPIDSADKDVVQKMKNGYSDTTSVTGLAVASAVFKNTLIITKAPHFDSTADGNSKTYSEQAAATYKITISRNV